ncbi:MAG: flagellar basal body-associated FliL family protein [Pseudomonadota bacterium]
MAEAEEGADEVATPKKSNKIIPIILVVNTLLMTGVLVFVMKRPSAQAAAGAGKEHATAKAEEHGGGEAKGEEAGHGAEGVGEGPGPTLRLENFIVQVRATEGDRYVHMTIEVEVGAETDKKPFESRMSRIRDAVIGYLSDRSEDELRGSEGLGQVKEALTKKLDDIVPGHRIRGLFITEFIIQ